jgi:hypothetical protein
MSQERTISCRRRIERTSAKVQVLVHCRGHFQRAKIADYSEAGLQLDGTFGLIPTDRIQIELISGVRVPGKVEWSLGGRTGVVFSERLDESHPVMVEIAQQANGPGDTKLQVRAGLRPQ